MKTLISLLKRYNELYNQNKSGKSEYFHVRFFYDESGCLSKVGYPNDSDVFDFYNFADFRKQIKKLIKEMENAAHN